MLTRLLTEVGQLVVQTRLLVKGLGERRDRVTHQAITTLQTMHEESAKFRGDPLKRTAWRHTLCA